MEYQAQTGVPHFYMKEYQAKSSDYCILIPIINEGKRIQRELGKAVASGVTEIADIIICDGGSKDGSTEDDIMKKWKVNTLLVKDDIGKQGAQLRMGIWWVLQRGYRGVITIDGNDKDSIEDIPKFIQKLKEGYDFIQGSRFIQGGIAENTPLLRLIAVRLIHAPVISLTARAWFTDTTNAYRGYSRQYLEHPAVQPLREIFQTYELLAYLSVRASQLGLKVCEIPVARRYPKNEKVPTKISFFKGNLNLFRILMNNFLRKYHPKLEK